MAVYKTRLMRCIYEELEINIRANGEQEILEDAEAIFEAVQEHSDFEPEWKVVDAPSPENLSILSKEKEGANVDVDASSELPEVVVVRSSVSAIIDRVLDEHNSVCLDDDDDRTKLKKALVKALRRG